MKYRLSKIYTRKGDDGYTSLRDERLSKDDLLVEAVGMLDELNACIGFTLSLEVHDVAIKTCLLQVQNDLFDMGGELHFPQKSVISSEKVIWLENQLDQWNETLPPLTEFILPGGTPAAASCHVSRTVCRRAERCLVKLHQQVALNNVVILHYLNRLSDLLFVIARVIAREAHQEEISWRQS